MENISFVHDNNFICLIIKAQSSFKMHDTFAIKMQVVCENKNDYYWIEIALLVVVMKNEKKRGKKETFKKP